MIDISADDRARNKVAIIERHVELLKPISDWNQEWFDADTKGGTMMAFHATKGSFEIKGQCFTKTPMSFIHNIGLYHNEGGYQSYVYQIDYSEVSGYDFSYNLDTVHLNTKAPPKPALYIRFLQGCINFIYKWR